MTDKFVKRNILGISLTNGTMDEVLEYVMDSVQNRKKKLSIVTPNPEIVVYASKHPEFKAIINEADIAVCDGIGLYLVAKYLKTPLKERISGVDLMEKLCSEASEKAVTVGFLGGRDGVAEGAAQCLREKYPGLKVSFTGAEWEDRDSSFPLSAKRKAGNRGIDILFVAYGFPKQEEWIAHNLPLLPIKVAMGVGGAFDYLSGEVARAPFFIRAIGLEWLFRLIRQPWRLKRQLKLLTFIKLVLQARK